MQVCCLSTKLCRYIFVFPSRISLCLEMAIQKEVRPRGNTRFKPHPLASDDYIPFFDDYLEIVTIAFKWYEQYGNFYTDNEIKFLHNETF